MKYPDARSLRNKNQRQTQSKTFLDKVSTHGAQKQTLSICSETIFSHAISKGLNFEMVGVTLQSL